MDGGSLRVEHVRARRGAEVDASVRLVDGRRGQDAAQGSAGDDVRPPVRELRRVDVVPVHAVVCVHAVPVDHVVGAVLLADAHHVARRTVDVDREQVRGRAEVEVGIVDVERSPAPDRRAVEADREDGVVVRRHGRSRPRRHRIGVGVAVPGVDEDAAASRVVGRR